MSGAAESLAACRTALEMISELSTEDPVRRLAGRALGILQELSQAELTRRVNDAERKRVERASRGIPPPHVLGNPPPSVDVHGRGVGGSLSEDLKSEPETLSLSGGVQGGRPRTSTDVHGQPRTFTRSTDDGVIGMAFAAFRDGVRSVTGSPFVVLRGAPEQAIVTCIVEGCPEPSKRVDWARAKGAEWARASGGKVNALHFPSWLASGARPPPAEQLSRRVDEEQRRLDAEYRTRKAQAAPPPPDLVSGLKGGRP